MKMPNDENGKSENAIMRKLIMPNCQNARMQKKYENAKMRKYQNAKLQKYENAIIR